MAIDTDQPVANKTRFTMVRFCNVLGSSGLVIPLFRAQLVIQACAMGQGVMCLCWR